MNQRNCTPIVWAVILSTSFLATCWLSALADDHQGHFEIHREGIRLDKQAVVFRVENEGLLMVLPAISKPLPILQNLAAQRVYRALRDDPNDSQWEITGSFTEFEDRNFFWIERAVRSHQRSKSPK